MALRRLAAAAQVLVRWAGPANAALTSLRSQKAFLTREARRAGERERAAVDALLEVALAARGDAEGGAEGGVGPLPQGVSEAQRLRGARRFRACVLVLLGARRLQASAAARAASGGGHCHPAGEATDSRTEMHRSSALRGGTTCHP